MSLSSFSLASVKNHKKAKSMFLYPLPDIEIDTSYIKQIGNYRLGEEIGSGAFGKVILGLHIITGEKVAIKILNKIILSETPEDYELVKQELSILKIVKHKYIVQLYEILETAQHIFIIMEYCEGQDIMDYILTRGHLSENESLKYFQQLINALYYLHSQNITHRDIKIDNLLLDRNLDLKLIDFGLSTKYRDDCLLNQPCGTVVYAAPEVLDCKEYHGMLADVWSSGIVLFGMMSGFLPFGDPDDEVNKKLVLQGNIEIPKFFSREATDLLKHMLDINPLKRYTLEEIMIHPWFNKKKFDLIPGIIIGINKIPVDEKIVNLCVTYNADKNKVRNSVINNKFNSESALYYLLVKKLKNCGNDSVSDLCSNKFIKYIMDETNRKDYINKLQNKFKINNNKLMYIKNELTKEKLDDKDRIKIISQLNDYVINYNYNFNGKIDGFDLSAAPGLVYDEPKKYNYNLINIENNYTSNNNSREYDENFENSDIINMNMNNKNNSSLEESQLKNNFGENELIKNYRNNIENVNNVQNLSHNEKLFTKGKMERNDALYKNKVINTKRNKIRIIGLDENEEKYNKSAYNNNKKLERYIYYKEKKNKLNENAYKKNLNKKKQNQPPLTGRNEYSKNKNNESSYYKYINSLQLSNIKKNNKNVPISKEFYKKTDIKNNNKENITKIIFKQDKKETLTKDITKNYLKQSKINNPLNVPSLNINNNKNKASYKKINNKKKYLNTNIYENPNEIYKKYISNFNKSRDSKIKLNTQRNNELSNRLLKNICNKNNKSSSLSDEKNLVVHNHNNMKKIFKNKLNSKSKEKKNKYLLNSLSKERKLNKSKVMNLLDNFHLYQRKKKTYDLNSININNFNNSNIKKTRLNKTSLNSNRKYTYNKKDFCYIQSSLLSYDYNNNPFNDDLNKDNGFNTDRTRNIFNLKKQSCFDQEKDNNIFSNNNHSINNNKLKRKVNDSNINNNTSHLTIKSEQNNLKKIKIKDYYLKRKKKDNSNKKDLINDSYSINCNKINNSIAQTTLSNNINNYIDSSLMINTHKKNTSRINVTMRNRKIKERDFDYMHKKMNTSISSSINKLKGQGELKRKISNSKNYSNDNHNKLDSLIKVGFAPNYKIRGNYSLSKEKNKNKKENNSINKDKKIIKKSHNLESSVVLYRKKSPYKIRDLSDSPKQKYLNEKTRNNRIPWKIKKKGIDEKLDSLSIYNRYMNHFKNTNPFKKKNLLKKKFKNYKKEKNITFYNNSKLKSNKYLFIPTTSNRKTLNISFTNYDKNTLFLRYNQNNFNNKHFNQNGASQEIYKNKRHMVFNSNNINNINENNNYFINKKKNSITTRYRKMNQGRKLKILNIRKRNDHSLNYNYDNFLTQTKENNSNQKENNEFQNIKNINKNNKKKFNNSISFESLYSSNDNERNNNFEDPFDLSCIFLTNRKIHDCINIMGNNLKKFGIFLSIKKNIINCIKNNNECQISAIKLNKGINCFFKENNIICYKAIDKKCRNNKIFEIFSRLILNNN